MREAEGRRGSEEWREEKRRGGGKEGREEEEEKGYVCVWQVPHR